MPRKKTPIDANQVEKLAQLGASNTEIANFFDVDKSTISRRFATILTKGRSMCKIKLRTLQWRAAEKGNVAMLIFLGKNMLDQSDKTITEHSGIMLDGVSDSQARIMAEEFLKSNASNEKKRELAH